MGEGKKTEEEDQEGTAVLKIAQETNLLIEERRKKENAKKMAKLMRNFNYDLLRGDAQEEEDAWESAPDLTEELELDELEMERFRKLQEMEDEMSAGVLLTQERSACVPKYEAPLIVQLRAVETVDELYQLADQIIPLSTLQKR